MPRLPGPPYNGADYPQPQGVEEVGWWGGKYHVDDKGVLHFREHGFFEDPTRCGIPVRHLEHGWHANPREWESECLGCFGEGAIF